MVPLRAIPIATPAEARSAAREVVFTPRVLIVIMISTTVSEMVVRLMTNEDRVFSAFLFSSLLTSHFLIRRMIQAPMM